MGLDGIIRLRRFWRVAGKLMRVWRASKFSQLGNNDAVLRAFSRVVMFSPSAATVRVLLLSPSTYCPFALLEASMFVLFDPLFVPRRMVSGTAVSFVGRCAQAEKFDTTDAPARRSKVADGPFDHTSGGTRVPLQA